MYSRYQQPNTKEKELYESLRNGELNQLTDHRCPLPAGLSTQGQIEETVRSLSKILLGCYDAAWGLDGGMPQGRRW
jgi:hypothetical protein